MAVVGKASARLQGVQALRGLAVLMVMSVHLFEVELKYTNGPRVFDRWAHFNMVGVDVFLVISGFVLTYLALGHFQDRHYWRSFVYARITRVYPVYILYTLALVPIFLIKPTLFNASEGHHVNLVTSLLLLPDVTLPLIPVAWTLHHEIYFYLVFALMLLWPQALLARSMLIWLVVTVALIAWGVMTPREEQSGIQRVLVNPINLEFLLGMVAALLIKGGERRGAWQAILIGLVWLVLGHLFYLDLYGVHWVDIYWRVALLGVPAVLIIYGVVVLELRGQWVLAPSLTWLGDAAYSVYLTHLLVMSLVGRIWAALGLSGWPAHIVFLLLVMGVALLAGKLAYDIVEKPMLRALRRWEPRRAALPSASAS